MTVPAPLQTAAAAALTAPPTSGRVLNSLRVTWQCAVALLLCAPLMLVAAVVWLPLSVLSWATVECFELRRKAASPEDELEDPLKGYAAQGLARNYISSAALAAHQIVRLWALLARPRVVFVVYHDSKAALARFFCLRTIQLGARLRMMDDFFTPGHPWFFGVGIIYCGPATGLALCVGTAPVLADATPEHLRKLPARVRAAFPSARAVALAGRLPGRVLASGGALAPVVVDGVAGTVFTVAEAARTLRERLPKERRDNATVAILGGGGFLGSRLVPVLAAAYPSKRSVTVSATTTVSPQRAAPLSPRPHAADSESFTSARSDATNGSAGGAAAASAPHSFLRVSPADSSESGLTEDTAAAFEGAGEVAWRGGCRVIAVDPCYKGRKVEGGVLRTSDPCDLSAADVVLVITARGNDAHDAACFAAPGQQWGDDTHPEMGSAVLRELRARGAEVHKVMAGRDGAKATRFYPPLPGWPSGGTPGCLLAALVTAETGRGWDGACPAAGGEEAAAGAGGVEAYEEFAAAARQLGFRALLKQHRPYLD